MGNTQQHEKVGVQFAKQFSNHAVIAVDKLQITPASTELQQFLLHLQKVAKQEYSLQLLQHDVELELKLIPNMVPLFGGIHNLQIYKVQIQVQEKGILECTLVAGGCTMRYENECLVFAAQKQHPIVNDLFKRKHCWSWNVCKQFLNSYFVPLNTYVTVLQENNANLWHVQCDGGNITINKQQQVKATYFHMVPFCGHALVQLQVHNMMWNIVEITHYGMILEWHDIRMSLDKSHSHVLVQAPLNSQHLHTFMQAIQIQPLLPKHAVQASGMLQLQWITYDWDNSITLQANKATWELSSGFLGINLHSSMLTAKHTMHRTSIGYVLRQVMPWNDIPACLNKDESVPINTTECNEHCMTIHMQLQEPKLPINATVYNDMIIIYGEKIPKLLVFTSVATIWKTRAAMEPCCYQNVTFQFAPVCKHEQARNAHSDSTAQ